MRLFLVHWSKDLPELVSVGEELTAAGHEIVYWVIDKECALNRSRFPHTIFHDVAEARDGRGAEGVDTSCFVPPGAKLLSELAEAESTVLTMMNKRFGSLSLAERKHFYYELVCYWNGIMRAYTPDAIIFPLVPHTVYDYVIYALAKRAGIQTIMFTATQDVIRLLPMTDYTEGPRGIREALERERGSRFTPADLRADMRRYVGKHLYSSPDATPHNMRNLAKYRPSGLLAILRALLDFSIFSKIFSYLKKRFGSNLRKEYAQVSRSADLTKRFVYLPLQYQPEATTAPMAGVFVDQRLLVETLSAALPPDWVIYVKEHPRVFAFFGLNFSPYRYRGYYAGLARLKNVRLVPAEADTFALIAASQAVALATGTAGLEATLRKKPVLVFGYAWYRDCPGVFSVRDTESCRDAFAKIQGGLQIREDELIRYFVCVDKASFNGYLETHMKKLAGLSESENSANLTKAILAELTKKL